jgi:hypothetical protein
MPELWFPYGGVETLVTIQAENLGTAVEPASAESAPLSERVTELLKNQRTSIFACDSLPTTAMLIKDAMGLLNDTLTTKVFATEPKKLESLAPELKGKVIQLGRVPMGEDVSPGPSPQLAESGQKIFVATAHPDPLYGLVDAKVQTALNWVSGTMPGASRKDFEPTPFEMTESYEEATRRLESLADTTYLSIVPRGGKAHQVLENAPFDAIRNVFLSSEVSPARGLIVGIGGKGYDDTLSSALRIIWSAIGGVKRGGEILLISECAGGMGSPALDLLASGRIQDEKSRRKEKYVPGIEETFYLSKLKEEYGVLLLSGLPEIFAKNKFGFSTARGSGEAVGRLLNKLGRTAKINLVTRAGECRILSA